MAPRNLNWLSLPKSDSTAHLDFVQQAALVLAVLHLCRGRENVRLLLTFVPSRMRSVPDRAVVLMYKPMHQPLPNVNPLGLRPQNLQRLMGYCCGSARPTSCPVGECFSFLQCLIFTIQESAWWELAVTVQLHSRLQQ